MDLSMLMLIYAYAADNCYILSGGKRQEELSNQFPRTALLLCTAATAPRNIATHFAP